MNVFQQWTHNDRGYRLISRQEDITTSTEILGPARPHVVLQLRLVKELSVWLDVESELLPDPADAQSALTWLYGKESLPNRCRANLAMPETCFTL